ncbi:hypothetical protein CEXT_3271 [Caerostris extrusa]|uniref:Uncharacterized protein n=1 Tax=Caerostris extrusa TaxID=172846 RepID=A0AAV4S9K7_CAEEX|nr:hypothetical protein CEXT_3271 [Caerostris extrusa]
MDILEAGIGRLLAPSSIIQLKDDRLMTEYGPRFLPWDRLKLQSPTEVHLTGEVLQAPAIIGTDTCFPSGPLIELYGVGFSAVGVNRIKMMMEFRFLASGTNEAL